MISTRFERIVRATSSLRTIEGRKHAARERVEALTVDQCVARHTAMATLAEIVFCTKRDGYRPTLRDHGPSTTVESFVHYLMAGKIADAYDAEMARLGRRERAYRGR